MATTRNPMPDFTARVVDSGRYQLIQKLGSGAYGVVYRAVDLKANTSSVTGSQVAIKILHKAGLTEREAINVRRELTLHRVMSEHPNVVSMHRAFEDKKYVYIVLDYCPGGDLFSKVCEEGVFFRNDALLKRVFLQIIDALYACHRKRIFHRDIKPENILCNEDVSEIYLSDFGLATNERVSGVFGCGSSFYMSPECIGKETDYIPYSTRHSDIWSLGVLLINMITARSPWEKAIIDDPCFSDYLVDDKFLRRLLPISKEAEKIINQIFALEPIDRISLPELYEAISDIDTFFMTDAEVANAPKGCQIAVQELLENTRKKRELQGIEKKLNQMKIKDIGRKGIRLPKENISHRDDTPITSPDGTPTSSMCPVVDEESSSDISSGPITPTALEGSEGSSLEWISNFAAKVRKVIPGKGQLRVVNQSSSLETL